MDEKKQIAGHLTEIFKPSMLSALSEMSRGFIRDHGTEEEANKKIEELYSQVEDVIAEKNVRLVFFVGVEMIYRALRQMGTFQKFTMN